jgi:hypothetical protein
MDMPARDGDGYLVDMNAWAPEVGMAMAEADGFEMTAEKWEQVLKFLSIMHKIEDRQADRNFVVHGTWGTLLPENVPVALSLPPKAVPSEVMSETFPPGTHARNCSGRNGSPRFSHSADASVESATSQIRRSARVGDNAHRPCLGHARGGARRRSRRVHGGFALAQRLSGRTVTVEDVE